MADRLRILIAGWLNSPHVSAWADAVLAAGHEVELAGRVVPGWPELELPAPSHRLSTIWPPPVQGLRMSGELGRLATALKPDLVHAHYLAEYGWMAAREGLSPLVCSAWGSDVLVDNWLASHRSRRALAGADLVFADSTSLASETHELAERDVRVELVRWGLDLDRFSPGDPAAARERLGLRIEGPLVAGVRGLRSIYNPTLQLEAFALVRAQHPTARLLVKHPGTTLPAAVESTIERLGLRDAVVIVGNAPAERLPDFYRAADVVLSIPSSDSSPRSVWEALACGRPVVVSDLPWARDELEPGERALLAPLEPGEVARGIARILDEPALAEQLAANGRAFALEELDPDACTGRIDSLYREVVAR